mgnify:CR=1 FL=1
MRRELIESYYEEYQRELERFPESDPEMFSLEAEIHHYIEILEPVLRGDGHWTELFQRKMPWKGLWQKKCIFEDFWIMKGWCVRKTTISEK